MSTADERWVLCPVCGAKTRLRILQRTVLRDFPMFCPKCRQESMINVQSFQIEKQISRTLRRSADHACCGLVLRLFFRRKSMKKTLIQKLGLLGVVSFVSYTAAVVFSPLAYPGYNWMAQAVSDLSAANAPSLTLWNQLSSFYNTCEVLCATIVCVGIQGRKTRLLRTGIYLFAVMEWVSAIGYRMFPLSSSGYAGTVQDVMHMAVTAAVVLLSIVSLITVIAAGAKSKSCRSYGICAAIALGMMLAGALGVNTVPSQYFGVAERFSVFAATGFNMALGIHLFRMEADTAGSDYYELYRKGRGETVKYFYFRRIF